MKIILTLFVTLMCMNVNSQKVVEQIIRSSEKYNPLFGSQSAALEIMYILSYDAQKRDSALNVVFQVKQEESKAQGGAVSAGVFGGRLAGAGSSYYTIERSEGTLIFNHQEFDSVATFFNSLIEQTKKNYGRNRIIMYSLKNFKLSLEINYKGGNDPEFAFERFLYLSVDNATFKLTESQFKDLTQNTINEIRKAWETWLQFRTLPMPMYN